jgi:hypothetical protein
VNYYDIFFPTIINSVLPNVVLISYFSSMLFVIASFLLIPPILGHCIPFVLGHAAKANQPSRKLHQRNYGTRVGLGAGVGVFVFRIGSVYPLVSTFIINAPPMYGTTTATLIMQVFSVIIDSKKIMMMCDRFFFIYSPSEAEC